MQHAYKMAKKLHGITVDPKEIDDKVASGPRKPSEGKTNSYRLKGDKGAIQVQVYNMGGKKYELNMYKEDVDLDEAIPKSEYYYVDPKGVVVAVGSKDAMRKMNMKQAKDGNKGGSFSQNSKKYKVGDKIKEEVDLDEGKMKDLLIKAQELMGPSKNRKEGIQMVAKGLKVSEKEATKLVDAVIKMNEELAKIKGKTPGDEGRRSAVEDDIERAEKKGDKKEVEKLKEADLDEKKKSTAQASLKDVMALDKKNVSDKKQAKKDKKRDDANRKSNRAAGMEEVDLEEGKMSQLHQYIKDKKSAEEIAKLMKVDVKTIKALMSSYESTDGDNMEQNSEYMEMLAAACGGGSGGGSMEMDYNPMEEGAAADARRAMKKDKDFSRRDRADDDDSATDDDIKAASKNIMMQMRKVISMRGDFKVEFGDKKKVKIPVKVAQVVQQKYNSMKKPADKEKFQTQVAKSYKDMLKVLKAGYYEELKPQKESILDRIDKKLKERKNG